MKKEKNKKSSKMRCKMLICALGTAIGLSVPVVLTHTYAADSLDDIINDVVSSAAEKISNDAQTVTTDETISSLAEKYTTTASTKEDQDETSDITKPTFDKTEITTADSDSTINKDDLNIEKTTADNNNTETTKEDSTESTKTDNTESENKNQTIMNVAYREAADIKAYIYNHPFYNDAPVQYDVEPDYNAPYAAGSLTQNTLYNTLNLVNNIRYIAGLSTECELNDNYNELAQSAAIVSYANGSISHSPVSPLGMNEELYNNGKEGCKKSNLASGFDNLNYAILNGFMNDSDAGNISKAGHRRWVLYPQLKGVGFGSAGTYYSMLVTGDDRNANATETGVAWPAQNMPIEFFGNDYSWTVSVGARVSESAKVKLTNLSTGAVYNFSKTSTKDGYFNVENSSYGQKGCIIFRPYNMTYSSGDRFLVEVYNIGASGLEDSFSYNVRFFSLNDKEGLYCEDGSWNYYENNNINYGYTGLVPNEYGWWYVQNGSVNFDYTGLASNEYGWWYVQNGGINFEYTGLVPNEYGWWYVQNGQVMFDYTGIQNNEYGWWYVNDGWINFNYNGLGSNEYGWWYAENGKVNFDHTGLEQNEYGWWMVINSGVDFSYTGLVPNEYGWWYVQNGGVNFNYTGMVNNEAGWWYVVNGGIDFAYTGMANNEAGWWYYVDGQIDWTHTGFEKNDYGTWYYKNGNIDFSYTDIVESDEKEYYVRKGQWQEDYTGTVTINGKEYDVYDGIAYKVLNVTDRKQKEPKVIDASTIKESPVDITDYTNIMDSVSADDNTNEYKFTAKSSGEYSFSFDYSEKLKLIVSFYDENDEMIYSYYEVKGTTTSRMLDKDKTYKIKVVNANKTEADYTLQIDYPQEEVDITDYDVVKDGFKEGTGLKNTYTLKADSDKKLNIKMIDITGPEEDTVKSVSVKVYDSNNNLKYSNLVATKGTTLNAGDIKKDETYKIVVEGKSAGYKYTFQVQ